MCSSLAPSTSPSARSRSSSRSGLRGPTFLPSCGSCPTGRPLRIEPRSPRSISFRTEFRARCLQIVRTRFRRPSPPVPWSSNPSPRHATRCSSPREPSFTKLERLRALLRHEVPDGDLAQIIEKAVSEKLERLEARRFGRTRAPRKEPVRTDPSSRHIPATVRCAVHQRDGGRCRFVDGQGRRCPERHRLEYHHRHSFGFGGGHGIDNICLMCRAHNQRMAEVDYGRKAMSWHSGSTRKTQLRPEWVGR